PAGQTVAADGTRDGRADAAALPPLRDRERLVLALLRRDGFSPRSATELARTIGLEERSVGEALDLLAAHRAVLRLGAIAYPADTFAEIERQIRNAAARTGSISLAELRDALDTSRKYAQAILERLDVDGVLVR